MGGDFAAFSQDVVVGGVTSIAYNSRVEVAPDRPSIRYSRALSDVLVGFVERESEPWRVLGAADRVARGGIRIAHPDDHFRFRAKHQGVDRQGLPFTLTELTVGLEVDAGATPGGKARLLLPYTTSNGARELMRVSGVIEVTDSRTSAFRTQLKGTDAALLCFRHLTSLYDAQLEVPLGGASLLLVTLGAHYADAQYHGRYSLTTVDGRTSAVTEELLYGRSVLAKSAEIPSLGDVRGKYPSFSHVYYGERSRTAILVPTMYGIRYGVSGCAAQCDAFVDLYAETKQDQRVQFRFGLAPILDPADLWMLSQAVAEAPEVSAGSHVDIRLPSGVDLTRPFDLQLPVEGDVRLMQSSVPTNVELVINFAGERADAVRKASRFLSSLASGPPGISATIPLGGSPDIDTELWAGLSLDISTATTSLGNVNSDLDLEIEIREEGPMLRNLTRFELWVDRAVANVLGESRVEPVDRVLEGSGTLVMSSLRGASDPADVHVSRRLKIDVPIENLRKYMRFTRTTEQTARLPITINGSGVDFDKLNVRAIGITIVFAEESEIDPQEVLVTPERRIADVVIVLPLALVMLRTPAILSIRTTFVDGQWREVHLQHDFSSATTFVLPSSVAAR